MSLINRIFIIFVTFLTIYNCHAIRQIVAESSQTITGYVNQPKSITIPFLKCFKVQPELESNSKYIDFKPTRIGLKPLKDYSLKNQGSNITTFQELRSPISYKHRNILVFEDYMMVLFAPNVVLVIQETESGFLIKNRYYLQNLDRFDQFKMYKLGNRGVLVTFNKQHVYILNKLDYQDYSLPEISTIIHIQQIPRKDQFFAAQFMKGLTHYRLSPSNKQIQIVQGYDANSFNLTFAFKYVVDVNLKYYQSDHVVYVLDTVLGLVQVDVLSSPFKAKVIISQKYCESFDSMERRHFVILCQNQGHSTIIEAYQYYDKKAKQYRYRKVDPMFFSTYLNDLHVTDTYYLVYSYKNMHVFWNSEKNHLPETLETQSEIIIEGLETFTVLSKNNKNYVYTIQTGLLKKYQLGQEKASLMFKSDIPGTKLLKMYLYGSCDDLQLDELIKNDDIQACKVTKNIVLKISKEENPKQQDFSISASLIVVLITMFLLVIWICLKKYRGLQRQARRVLQNYKKKRNNKRSAI